jgi:hypothetical protein
MLWFQCGDVKSKVQSTKWWHMILYANFLVFLLCWQHCRWSRHLDNKMLAQMAERWVWDGKDLMKLQFESGATGDFHFPAIVRFLREARLVNWRIFSSQTAEAKPPTNELSSHPHKIWSGTSRLMFLFLPVMVSLISQRWVTQDFALQQIERWSSESLT